MASPRFIRIHILVLAVSGSCSEPLLKFHSTATEALSEFMSVDADLAVERRTELPSRAAGWENVVRGLGRSRL